MKSTPTADPMKSPGATWAADPRSHPGRHTAVADAPRAGSRSLWCLVGVVFLCLATAYVIVFFAARAAQIREVPLATQGGRR
jgi:hypothetical protein